MAFVNVIFGTMKDVNIHSCSAGGNNKRTYIILMSVLPDLPAAHCHRIDATTNNHRKQLTITDHVDRHHHSHYPPPGDGGGIDARQGVTFTLMDGVDISACSAEGNGQIPHHLAMAMVTIAVLTATCRRSCRQRTYQVPSAHHPHTILSR